LEFFLWINQVELDEIANIPRENSVKTFFSEKSSKFSSEFVLFGIISASPNPENPATINKNAIRVTVLADKNTLRFLRQLVHNYYAFVLQKLEGSSSLFLKSQSNLAKLEQNH